MTRHDHDIPERDPRGLRDFALATAAMLAGLFGVLFPWLLGAPWPWWPWAIAAILSLWGLVAPATLAPLYRGWMRFGLLLNRVVSPLVLGLMFFVVLTPVALVMRVAGRDTMARTLRRGATTYRVDSRHPDKDHMERPF